MNEITIFQDEQFGRIRTVERDGEPWFVAADVCQALDLGNPSQAIARLDDDEKGNTIILNEGIAGNPNKSIISESGLYSLVLGSRKPEARAFKRWITHKVIPSIRKTGGYLQGLTPLAEAMKQQTALMMEAITSLGELTRRVDELEQSAMEPDKPKRRRLKPPITIIGMLDTELKQVVEDMLLSGRYTYAEISRIMREQYGIQVSKSSIWRYASHLYMETAEC